MNQYEVAKMKRKTDEQFFQFLRDMAAVYVAKKWRERKDGGVLYGVPPYDKNRIFRDYKEWLKTND